jgi:hypothetical protein
LRTNDVMNTVLPARLSPVTASRIKVSLTAVSTAEVALAARSRKPAPRPVVRDTDDVRGWCPCSDCLKNKRLSGSAELLNTKAGELLVAKSYNSAAFSPPEEKAAVTTIIAPLRAVTE